MEEFSLKKYNTGDYDVITRDVRSARILCTDMLKENGYHIVALVKQINGNDFNIC